MFMFGFAHVCAVYSMFGRMWIFARMTPQPQPCVLVHTPSIFIVRRQMAYESVLHTLLYIKVGRFRLVTGVGKINVK